MGMLQMASDLYSSACIKGHPPLMVEAPPCPFHLTSGSHVMVACPCIKHRLNSPIEIDGTLKIVLRVFAIVFMLPTYRMYHLDSQGKWGGGGRRGEKNNRKQHVGGWRKTWGAILVMIHDVPVVLLMRASSKIGRTQCGTFP